MWSHVFGHLFITLFSIPKKQSLSNRTHIVRAESRRVKAVFPHPAAAKQPPNEIHGIFNSETRMDRMQKRARERLWYTARCLVSVRQKLSSVCLYPDNRDWTHRKTRAQMSSCTHSHMRRHKDTNNTCVYSNVTPSQLFCCSLVFLKLDPSQHTVDLFWPLRLSAFIFISPSAFFYLCMRFCASLRTSFQFKQAVSLQACLQLVNSFDLLTDEGV